MPNAKKGKKINPSFGELTERIVATAGDHVPAEIEYVDKSGEVVGYWAYGSWCPDYPYQGEENKNARSRR